MRSASAAFRAAQAAGSAVPAYRLEIADSLPHFGSVAVAGADERCAAVLAPDGAVVCAQIVARGEQYASDTVLVTRAANPGDPASWSPWRVLANYASIFGGVCLAAASGTLRLLWADGTGTRLLHADSADSGATWTLPAALLDPGHTIYGIACAGDLDAVVLAYNASGINGCALALWRRGGGVWAGQDWSSGVIPQVDGLSMVPLQGQGQGQGYLIVFAVRMSLHGGPLSLQVCTVYTQGIPTWTGMTEILPVDTSMGLVVGEPRLSAADGLYRLSYLVADDGSRSGTAYGRCARSVSPDGTHWADGLEDSAPQPYGAVWLRHAAGELLLGHTVRLALPYRAAPGQYRDLSADIVSLELAEQEGAAARLTVTLDDDDGHLLALPCLRPNAQLLLSQGFAGTELLGTHLLYLREWSAVRAAAQRQLVLVADDRLAALQRVARRPRLYTGCTVTAIACGLAAAGGLDQPPAVDNAGQYQTVVPSFSLQAGEPYVRALSRLLAIYDGSFRLETLPGSGPAFPYVERLRLAAKSAADPVALALDTQLQSLRLTRSGDRANRVSVYWTNSAGACADLSDFADMDGVGAERPAVAVDVSLGSAGNATLRAILELAREQRFALAVEALASPLPQLELLDVVTLADRQLGLTACRLRELRLQALPGQARCTLRLRGGGV